MKVSVIIFAAATISLTTACASAPTRLIEVDSIQFKGDSLPAMTSADLLRNDYSKLTEGETVVVAISADNTGAVSQPNFVNASITEVVAENSERSLEQMRSKCDIDSDGIWDKYCPELVNELLESESESFVMFDSAYTISRVTSGRDDWLKSTSFDRNDVVDQTQPIYVRLLSVNRGNKVFTGDLDMIVQVPPQVEFRQIKDLYKVRNNDTTKAVVGGVITAMGILAGTPVVATSNEVSWIKNYNRVESYQNFKTQNVNRKLSVTANDIEIKPGEGVELIYEVSYQFADQ